MRPGTLSWCCTLLLLSKIILQWIIWLGFSNNQREELTCYVVYSYSTFYIIWPQQQDKKMYIQKVKDVNKVLMTQRENQIQVQEK